MAALNHPGDRPTLPALTLAAYSALDDAQEHLDELRKLAAADPQVSEAEAIDIGIEHGGGFLLSLARAGVYAAAAQPS